MEQAWDVALGFACREPSWDSGAGTQGPPGGPVPWATLPKSWALCTVNGSHALSST